MKKRLGIDLGGTKIEVAVFDESFTPLWLQRVSTPASYRAMLSCLQQQIGEACTQTRLAADHPVGMGIPGSPNPTSGNIRNANTLVLNGKNLAGDLQEISGHPVRLANDANCFALSEAMDGAAQDASSMFGVILGTGCGGGLVIGGKLWSGASGIGGEWGHNSLPWPADHELPGIDCWCGQTGCIETWLSGPGMLAHYQSRGGTAISVEEISRRAQEGAKTEIRALQTYSNRLARSLAALINIVDVEMVVLGGGLSHLPNMAKQTQDQIHRWIFSDAPTVKIVRNQHGDSSGIRGAARLWDQT
jgi:fructokinase